MAKIALIAGFGKSLVNFRGDLIKKFIDLGHEVYAIAPKSDYDDAIRGLGCVYYAVPLARTGVNPLADLGTFRAMVKVLREIQPDVVFSYTIKPIIYGSLAARVAGVGRVYSMVSGLGYAFGGTTLKQKVLGRLVKLLYKQALRNNQKVFFQNPDDMKRFQRLKLLPADDIAVLVNGSGVNINHYQFQKAPVQSVSFLLMARLIWDKGIGQLVEASRFLKQRYPEVRVKLLGSFDVNPTAIRRETVATWEEEGVLEYLGETNDVRPFLADASVYVLPSYYLEGTPRSILEALAVGRPIITTDMPGCRETVQHGLNGYLVPPGDSEALATAMERFIVEPGLIATMGACSRQIAEEKYDVYKVNQSILQAMGLV